jgi:hypothetical protein
LSRGAVPASASTEGKEKPAYRTRDHSTGSRCWSCDLVQ